MEENAEDHDQNGDNDSVGIGVGEHDFFFFLIPSYLFRFYCKGQTLTGMGWSRECRRDTHKKGSAHAKTLSGQV